MLSMAGRWVGLPFAEHIVVPLCVLVFFWGTFAFVAAVSGRQAWAQVPLIAMLAYGWTFHAGFLNYYLSIGIGSLAAAWLIGESRGRRLGGLGLLALAYMAHPLGAAWGGGAAVFVTASRRLHGIARLALAPAIAVVIVVIVHIGKTHFQATPRVAHWWAESGIDQFYVFGRLDRIIALSILAIGAAVICSDILQRQRAEQTLRGLRMPSELYGLTVALALVAPSGILLPQYTIALGWLNERLTMLSAVMLICVLNVSGRRRILCIANSLLALAFFAVSFSATGLANRIEGRVRDLLHTLPRGSRVVYSVDIDFKGVEPSKFFNHLIDRACVDWCFVYSNYEPPTKQFRVRVQPGSPVETDSATLNMHTDTWRPKRGDLPVWLVYQAHTGDTLLAIRPLPPCAPSERCTE